MTSQARQNYHQDVEAAINKQINLELNASYVYLSLAHYFDRDDVALPGFHAYFKKASDEEREHAEKLMTYQNKRGGRIVFADVQKPARDTWGSALDAVTTSLELEKSVNQSLLDLHGVGSSHGDTHCAEFIEEAFLEEQVESIKQLSDLASRLRRAGPGLGEYLFDRELQKAE